MYSPCHTRGDLASSAATQRSDATSTHKYDEVDQQQCRDELHCTSARVHGCGIQDQQALKRAWSFQVHHQRDNRDDEHKEHDPGSNELALVVRVSAARSIGKRQDEDHGESHRSRNTCARTRWKSTASAIFSSLLCQLTTEADEDLEELRTAHEQVSSQKRL